MPVEVSLMTTLLPHENSSLISNRTTTPDQANTEPLWRITTTGFLLCLVILFTLVGNGLVVIAVGSTRRLRSSVTNYFVVSLAVADLTVAVLVMPYAVLYELYGRWTFGWAFCYFWISCDVTCCTASILHLCLISVDRYLAVTEPLTYRSRMTRRRALLAVVGVWTCSSAISFVPIYAGWFVDDSMADGDGELFMRLYEDGPTCGLFVNRAYAVISSTTSFYLPLVVMLILYAKIFRIARRQAAEIREQERSLCAAQRATDGRLRRRSRRAVSDTKAVKTLGTLMGLFCASWLPFFILYVVKPFCAAACHVPPEVDVAVTWLGYCNSFINPCVYAFLNRDFRSAFGRVLSCGTRTGWHDASPMAHDHRSTATSTVGTKMQRVDVEAVAATGRGTTADSHCRDAGCAPDSIQMTVLQLVNSDAVEPSFSPSNSAVVIASVDVMALADSDYIADLNDNDDDYNDDMES